MVSPRDHCQDIGHPSHSSPCSLEFAVVISTTLLCHIVQGTIVIMSVFFQRFPAHIVRSGARVSGVKTLTPTSHLNISQPGDLTRLARRASSKVPVYFSQENNQQNRGSLPGNLPPTPPVYFSHASQGQGHGASPVQPTKQKRSRWATTIALSSLLASLYISGTFFYLGYCNREEVPFVERVRYNIYSDEAISDELSAKRQLSHFGLPSLEAMATSSLILPHESDNEKANLAYAIFEKLVCNLNSIRTTHLAQIMLFSLCR